MADLLSRLSERYGCDKFDRKHRYTQLYNARLNKHRSQKFNMLEFGYGKGSSCRMWLKYFPNVNLVSVDIGEIPDLKDPRFEYIQADQIDAEKISEVIVKYNEFFLVVDDASHVAEDQQFTLGYMFPFVEPGGWYVIEDLKCKRNHSLKFDVKCSLTESVLRNYVKTCGDFFCPILNESQKMYLRDHIEDIQIYNKIAFIRKR